MPKHPDTKAFVFASGRALRWGGRFKQLCEVDGEPIIIRMVKETTKHIPVTVVTPHAPIVEVLRKELPNDVIAHWLDIIDVGGSPPLLTETIKMTARAWTKRNLFLLADCWYSDRAFAEMFENLDSDDVKFYGRRRMSGLTLNGPEIFSWQFTDKEAERAISACDAAKKQFEDSDRKPYDSKGCPHGSAWQLYRGMFGIPLEEHMFDADDRTDKATSAWHEINDFTDDFDSEDRFEFWKERYAQRLFLEPKIKNVGKLSDWEIHS